MREKLKVFVQEWIKTHWKDAYTLDAVLPQAYGYSLVFMNQKTHKRFSPTMILARWVSDFFLKGSDQAKLKIEKEVETAIFKEQISG